MKKLIFILFTIFLVVSCNKKSKPVASEQTQALNDIDAFKGAWFLTSAEDDGIQNLIDMGLGSILGIYSDGTFKLEVTVNGEKTQDGEMKNAGTWTFSSDGKYLDTLLPDKEYGGFTKGTIKKIGKNLYYKNPADNAAMIYSRN